MNRPNVILVLTDDQGYGDLGCHGNRIVQTPNIDSFYDESSRFTNYHVGPTCAPTRAGLFTGHYANSTGVWHTIGGRSLLRGDEWTIADAMKSAGWKTAIFGKWHLGDEYPYLPHYRGFEKSLIHKGGGISQAPDYWGNDYFDDTYYDNGKPVKFSGYCTDVWFDKAIEFIEENRDNPFLCCITPNAPHSPYNVPKKYSDMYAGKVPAARAAFYGMITNIDENFGKLRRKLQTLGIEDDTVLIFMTDNGTSCGCSIDDEGFVTDGYNAGMRGVKGWPYEGGHRTPFFIRWARGGINKAADINNVTGNIDFMPTILDLCGIDDGGRTFHGKSLVPLLEGGARQDRVIVTDSQRLVNPVKWRLSSVMTDNYRLINGSELYDISCDPEQRCDISAQHQDIVNRLRDEYEKWWRLVSGKFEQEIPIPVGAELGEQTVLCCHDWRFEPASGEEVAANLHNWRFDDCDTAWSQGHIRQAKITNGYWEVYVQKTGIYKIKLCRWPQESGHSLKEGFEGDDVQWRSDIIASEDYWLYRDGRAIDIVEAKLIINGKEYVKDVTEDKMSADFQLRLSKGPANLKTIFTLSDNTKLGAYYAYLTRITE
ncbi:Arylsulfatase [Limihaloglobus sulfuriphilus]|uniref:Arylsulfatase n=1 Tax=Limihaloglobus sulfuriphilus TaxID=1851148 RepID=A0A1Q2MDN2_9BACT|nr:arylsulfatase [Limihaloglobus sulfuriphilus]AQQ70372.1 Arylsulfatase [Limihaloglobus sulfuriphilus]